MSLPLSIRLLPLLWLVLALLTPAVFGQAVIRSGGEFSIIGTRPGDQLWPQLALDSTGGYIVWQDNTLDAAGLSIGAQRLNNRLIPDTDPFRVNLITAADQERPHVALLANGGAVVVWQGGKLGFQRIYARFLNPDGTFLTSDVPVGEHTTSSVRKWNANRWIWVQNRLKRQRLKHKRTVRHIAEANNGPKVVALPDGGAVVVYSGVRKTVTNVTDWLPQFTVRNRKFFTNSVQKTVSTQIDRMQEILLQRLSASGEVVGDEITVNQYSDFNQRSPAVALLPDGNLLVVWVSEHEFARPLAASIESILPATGAAQSAALGRILGENRVVLVGRILTPDGQPVSDEFRLDGEGAAVCANPDILVFDDGSFTVAWSQRSVPINIGWDIMARAFAADGTPLGDPGRLNSFQRGDQAGPKLVDAGGVQFALWTSIGQDGSREGIYGCLVSGGLPVGDEIAINTTTRQSQRQPAIVAHNGQLVAAWTSFAGLGHAMELVAQKFIVSGAGSLLVSEQNVRPNYNPYPPVPPTFGEGDSTRPPPLPPPGPADATSLPDPSAIHVNLQATGSKLTIAWNTQADAAYQVQASTNLSSWTDVGPERPGTGAADSVRFETAAGATFYRVKRTR